ncbi:putative RNA-directed DNA polymerase [Helianthus annuus]|nr:putative RNA-directed DNA polymerase [Helianthus annuus]
MQVSNPPDSFLMTKLARIRSALKSWRDEFLLKEKESELTALSELEKLEEEMELKDLSEEEEWIMTENRKIIQDIDYRKRADIKQKGRLKWAIDGDENTKFFHVVVNNRKAVNSIHGFNIDGEWCTKPSKIKKMVYSFFRDKFKDNLKFRPHLHCFNIKKISEAESLMLVEPFSENEIKNAVFECGDDRSPGPDGFNFRFIKHFWEIFKEDFVRIFEWFHAHGVINDGCGASFIALIAKISDPVSLNNYRPINLVGVISKVISKVMANRMRMVLESVISDSQSAFLKGRYILDGPLIINELISWIKKSKMKAFFLKIDFEKAYDNVNWNFVTSILSQMGFPDLWCKWVLGILKSASSSVLVNGAPTFLFRCEKGMRQGDPLSPFLFLVVMEALSCMINRAKNADLIKGIATPNNGPVITHLLYADDSIVVGEWSKSEMVNIVRVFRCFFLCSGLKINIEKSNLYGIGVGVEETNELASEVGCKPDVLPFKYLGLNVGANMNQIRNWQPVYDIFRKRLAIWKSNLLSIGGRVVIIKAVLESLPCYYFSLYKAPKKVISDLESMVKKFLWGGSIEERKTHWVAWDRVTMHKKDGGLGLNRLSEVNISLLSKWGWRYKSEANCYWRKIIDAIHHNRVSWDGFSLKKSLKGVWNNIVKVLIFSKVGGSVVRNYIQGAVGNGESIHFWLDPWIISEPLKLRFPGLFRLEADKKCSIADRVKNIGMGPEFLWHWRTALSDSVLLSELQQLLGILGSVMIVDRQDKWRWSPHNEGIFSVKSVKGLCYSDRFVSHSFVMDWCDWVPDKCNIHVWRAEMEKIPSKVALRKRNILQGEPICMLCSSADETAENLYTACYVSAIVWNMVSEWCRIPGIYAFSIKDLLCFHKDLSASVKKKEAVQGLIIITCWSLWRARNKLIFSNTPVKIDGIISEIKSLGFLWFSNRSKYKGISWEEWVSFVNM